MNKCYFTGLGFAVHISRENCKKVVDLIEGKVAEFVEAITPLELQTRLLRIANFATEENFADMFGPLWDKVMGAAFDEESKELCEFAKETAWDEMLVQKMEFLSVLLEDLSYRLYNLPAEMPDFLPIQDLGRDYQKIAESMGGTVPVFWGLELPKA